MLRKFLSFNRTLSKAFQTKFKSLVKKKETKLEFQRKVLDEIDSFRKENTEARILEIGGIDRPFLERADDFTYVGLDVEKSGACDRLYDEFYVQSIEDPVLGSFDLVFSQMLLEHVPNNEKSWQNIFDAIKPGGFTCHTFPSAYHPYSIITRVVGNNLQRKLISLFRPESENVTGYKVYYNKCSYRSLKKLLEKIGYTDIRIVCSYSAEEYFRSFFPAFVAIILFNRFFSALRIKAFASNIYVSARRPMPLEATQNDAGS